MTEVRKGQAPGQIERAAFHERFMDSYRDPAFRSEADALARIEVIAWKAYQEGRKAPVTRKAGPGFADPEYELSVDWLEARDRIAQAQANWSLPDTPSRVLLINGSRATMAAVPARCPRHTASCNWRARCSKRSRCRRTYWT